MITNQEITEITEKLLDSSFSGEDNDLFLVDVRVLPGCEIEIVVDSDRSAGVGIDRCAAISRGVEQAIYERWGDGADFSLTVFSAGIGQPIRLRRQFERLLGAGAEVEVLYGSGLKQVGRLVAVDDLGIEIAYQALELLEGEKRKKSVEKRRRVLLEEAKQIVEYLKMN